MKFWNNDTGSEYWLKMTTRNTQSVQTYAEADYTMHHTSHSILLRNKWMELSRDYLWESACT